MPKKDVRIGRKPTVIFSPGNCPDQAEVFKLSHRPDGLSPLDADLMAECTVTRECFPVFSGILAKPAEYQLRRCGQISTLEDCIRYKAAVEDTKRVIEFAGCGHISLTPLPNSD